MMEDGWIKIYPHRLLEWEWYDDANMFRLFMHLLLKANYKDKQWHGVTIKRGQLVTSLGNLSAETGLTLQTVRTCLARLTNTGEINKQVTHRFTLITVCKYGKYQQSQQADQHDSNTLPTSKQQATNTPLTTTKETKNNRIEETTTNVVVAAPTSPSVDLDAVKDFFNRTMANSSIPKLRTKIDGRRKEMLIARIREHGIESVYEVFTKASTSLFLNGGGSRGFVADFEWLMRPNNFPKVLEGNYDNHETSTINNGHSNNGADRNAKLMQDGARAIAALAAEGGKPAELPF